jgi:hypothetical protein
MLDHLHQKAAQTLASVDSVILSSFGLADIQISRVACVSDDLTLYVFISRSSDHLLNLEYKPEVVIATDSWELHGIARVLSHDEIAARNDLPDHNSNAKNQTWESTVEIRPTRLTFHSLIGQGNSETIDFY